jgi:hypothetical protein
MRQKILQLINRRYFTDEDVLALGKKAVLPLIALFDEVVNDEMDTQRQTIIYMLGLLNGNKSVAFLTTLYSQFAGKNDTLQMAVLSALARTDHESALKLVLPLLETGDKRTRKNVIVGLRHSKRAEVLEKVQQCAQSDSELSLRGYAERVAAEIEAQLPKD